MCSIITLSFLKTLFFFFIRILFRQFRKPKALHRTFSNLHATHIKYQKYTSFVHRSDQLSDQVLIFNMEEVLLKSSSLFPYFMLVAFEAGGLVRAFFLFVLYPFISLAGDETGLKIMVMVSFFGIKRDNFRIGTAVLPKFFLENVGLEIYEALKQGGKTVAVSNMPQVMIDSFLRDYLEIDLVVGRELKSFRGYFVGLMEERKKDIVDLHNGTSTDNVIGIGSVNMSLDHHKLFLQCNEIYLVRSTDKRSWQNLPRNKYPKPLVFHDGRLAFSPTPSYSLVMFMWIPFGVILAILRISVGITLPYKISIPLLAFSGLPLTVITKPETSPRDCKKPERMLYICNHRTLLDAMYLCFTLTKNITAVTYSLSRMSEIVAPIKTVRLRRNKDQDANIIERLLNQGDVVICPEGTTCREPYLLRFSPLFVEMSDNIIPVATNTNVTMFYGTTASGLKCLDPIFFLMNPSPSYTMQLLEGVSGQSSCAKDGEKSKFEVANYVQSELGKALGFECTMLTRKHKYQILARNDGIA